jgi:hypothetical protein
VQADLAKLVVPPLLSHRLPEKMRCSLTYLLAKDAIEVWNEPSRVSHDSWKFPNPKLNNATDLDHA